MLRRPATVALALAAVAGATACGSGAVEPAGRPAHGGEVYRLELQGVGGLAAVRSTEWYDAASGAYAVRGGFAPDGSVVYDGSRFVEAGGGAHAVYEGGRRFLEYVAAPHALRAPATTFFQARRDGTTGEELRIREAVGRPGVLIVDWKFQTDTEAREMQFEVRVSGPFDRSDPRVRTAFDPPSGRPTQLTRQGTPGEPSTFEVTSYWLGPEWDDARASGSIESTMTAGQREHSGALHDPLVSHLVVYRTVEDAHGIGFTGPYPYPGIGERAPGDTYVTSMPLDSPMLRDGPPDERPVTLADGTHATLIDPGGLVVEGLFYVRTGDALVKIDLARGGYASPDEAAAALRRM